MDKKVNTIIRILLHSYKTLRFNFHYLPFKQAIRVPFIFECDSYFYTLKGKIIIECQEVRMGMIRFKSRNVGVYDPKQRFVWEHEGTIIFKGRGVFKAGSSISIGKNGTLTLGNNFAIGPLNFIICTDKITIGDNYLSAWEIMILDTDFHHTFNFNTQQVSTKTKPIIIGDNCWIGTRAILYKGTEIPPETIVAGMTILNKKYNIPSYCLLAGSPAVVKSEGICRLFDDNVSNEEIKVKESEYNSYKATCHF